MGRIIIMVFLLAFAFPGAATEAEETALEQHEAGQWVNDWWANDRKIEMNKNLTRTGKMRCRQKLTYYAYRLDKKPKSEYFTRKLEKWIDKCGQVRSDQ